MLKIKIYPSLASICCYLPALRAQKTQQTEPKGGRILMFIIYLFSKKFENTKIQPHMT